MNYFENEKRISLERRKGRTLVALESAETNLKRHQGVKGYGNEVWADLFERRVIELKQRLYEINLELSRYEPQFVGMTHNGDDALAVYVGVKL